MNRPKIKQDKLLLKCLICRNNIVYRNNLLFLCFLSLFSWQFTLAQLGTTQELSAISTLDITTVSSIENVALFIVSVHAVADVGFNTTQDSNTEILEVVESNQCGKSFHSRAVAKSNNSTHSNTVRVTTKQVIDWIKNSSPAAFFSVKNIFVTAVPLAKPGKSAIVNKNFKRGLLPFSVESTTCGSTLYNLIPPLIKKYKI